MVQIFNTIIRRYESMWIYEFGLRVLKVASLDASEKLRDHIKGTNDGVRKQIYTQIINYCPHERNVER